ncbi:hypothetical protein DC083_02835 [Ignatzschineria ureiclastica]|uniref:Trimeric autotransporter adhesin YadA-like C-terminal membrane anchor domain-containing protein n=1 Tax=Ignatzschineria ureiclastica TaxID=472582 RepID=A0A2U2AFG5_9GAMM|nr:hypothetical protein DC083_02835 [Ignatzschineria ureiclastica]
MIAGVADGKDGKDAVNKGQLDEVKEGLTEAGLKFAGNKGEVQKKLGETLTIKGDLADDADATAENLRVDVNDDGDLVVKMSSKLTGINDLQVGKPGKDGEGGVDGKIGVNGKDGSSVVINGEDGSIGLTGPAGKNGKSPELNISVKDGSPGLDGKDGEVRIVYKDKEGNEKEVASLDDGLKFGADRGDDLAVKLNEKLDIKGDDNITTSVDENGIKVNLAKNLNLGEEGSVTTGNTIVNNGGVKVGDNVLLNGTGLTIIGKDGKPGPSITQDGINAGGNKITGVATGEEDADAVNLAQLKNVQAKGDVGLDGIAEAFGGGAEYDKETGRFKAPNYTVALSLPKDKAIEDGVEAGFEYVGETLADHEGRIEENTTNIQNITQGTAGLVKLDGDKIVIDNELAKGADTFDFSNNEGATRTLAGVTAGKVGTDAVNVTQLGTALGGGSLDDEGNWQGPTYEVGGKEVNNVGDAITNIDQSITNINQGTAGLVKLDGEKIVIDNNLAKDANVFDFSNVDENGNPIARKLVGVDNGIIANHSTDAINGGQLFEILGTKAVLLSDGQPVVNFSSAFRGLPEGQQITTIYAGFENLDKRVTDLETGQSGVVLVPKPDGVTGNGDTQDVVINQPPVTAKPEVKPTTPVESIPPTNGSGSTASNGNRGDQIIINNDLAGDRHVVNIGGANSTDDNPLGDRKLTGVADGKIGEGSSDAINGSQLYTSNNAIANLIGGGAKVDNNGNVYFPENAGFTVGGESHITIGGAINALDKNQMFKLDRDKNQIIIANEEVNQDTVMNLGGHKLTGITNGAIEKDSTDAVNGGQLWELDQKVDREVTSIQNQFKHYDTRLNTIEKTVHQNRKIASAGIAGAMAMASMPYVETSKYSFGLGTAVYDSEAAISAGFTFKMGEKSLLRINASYDTQNKAGVGIGVAFGWD